MKSTDFTQYDYFNGNTELGDEGGEDKKTDEVSSADGCDGLGGILLS